MAFITKEDFKGQIKDLALNQILEEDDTILDSEISVAVATVKSYLFDRYSVDDIFDKEGEARELMLVRHCIHIVLYNLYQRVPNARELPLKTKNYEETLNFLEKVAQGKVGLDLPRRESVQGTNKTRTRFGSNLSPRHHSTDVNGYDSPDYSGL